MEMMTDKTGKIAVVSREMYLKMGEMHTNKDKKISGDRAREVQKQLNGHTSMLIKITKMGEDWKHSKRIRETCINQSVCVPPMYLLYKDHKKTMENEVPKSRPVVSSKSGMGIHINNILSDLTEPMADALENKIEVISSEELENKIDQLNKLIEIQEKEGEDTGEIKESIDLTKCVLTGADAVTLYPSMLRSSTSVNVREEALQTRVKFEGIDYQEAARYVAINYEPWEVYRMRLGRVIPRRVYNKGCKPGMKGKEVLGREAGDEIKWEFPKIEHTELEKRKLVAAVLEIGIRTIFKLHVYQFGGNLYEQTDGGPIGLRITGSCAKIMMGRWAVKVNTILEANNMKIWLAAGYIDDMRYLTPEIPTGVRWCSKEKKMRYTNEWKKEDEKSSLSGDKRTSREIESVMNSIQEHKIHHRKCRRLLRWETPHLRLYDVGRES